MELKIEETQGAIKVSEEPQKQAEKPVIKEEPKYVKLEDLEKVNQAINNTRDYNNSKLEEINLKLEKLMPKAPEAKPDDVDELVQKDWKAGVTKVIEDVLTRKSAQTQAETQVQTEARILEDSKQKAMGRHKELSDPNSEKTKEFLKVLDENPDFKTNPRGPLLAVYEMENRLNSRDKINSGVEKQVRARGASVPAGTAAGGKSEYQLTKADADFCKLNNINPESYRRMKGMREAVA